MANELQPIVACSFKIDYSGYRTISGVMHGCSSSWWIFGMTL